MSKPLCQHEVRRFSAGAKKGLGRAWYDTCSNYAAHDPDEHGVPTRCGTHCKAAIDRRKAKRDDRRAESMAEFQRGIERLKEQRKQRRAAAKTR